MAILQLGQGDEWLAVTLTATTGADVTGDWFDTQEYHSGSIEVDFGAAATGNVTIYGSNKDAPAASDGVAINAAAYTADALASVECLPRWIRAAATTVVNTITVRAIVRKP
jgi:hypothetical protein